MVSARHYGSLNDHRLVLASKPFAQITPVGQELLGCLTVAGQEGAYELN